MGRVDKNSSANTIIPLFIGEDWRIYLKGKMFGVADIKIDIESYYMSLYDQNIMQGVIKTTFIVLNYSVCLLFSTTLKTERTVFAIQHLKNS